MRRVCVVQAAIKGLGFDRSVDIDKMLDDYGAAASDAQPGLSEDEFQDMVTARLAHSFLSPEQLQVLSPAQQTGSTQRPAAVACSTLPWEALAAASECAASQLQLKAAGPSGL